MYRHVIDKNFHPLYTSELYRLFAVPNPDVKMSYALPSLPLDMPTRPPRSSSVGCDSGASSPGACHISSPWNIDVDFKANGVETDLDELDLLVRGMEDQAVDDAEPDPCFSSPPLSSSPGSSTEVDANILTKERLLEILSIRERERQATRRRRVKGDKVCVFCRNNGESELVYSTHQLKDSMGNVTCPVLYIYTCPICSATGQHAHTIKYCPMNGQDKKTKKKAPLVLSLPHHAQSHSQTMLGLSQLSSKSHFCYQ